MKRQNEKNDLSFDESRCFRWLEEAFIKSCRQFGYREIRTATIEPLYIFTGLNAISETRRRRIYSFIDWDGWSGERVALKPDSTACVARFYGERLLSENPRRKICYVENHFEWSDNWDEISERWQCGIENIGVSNPESDAEVIFMAWDVLKAAGLNDIHLRLSYPSLADTVGGMDSVSGLPVVSESETVMRTADYIVNIFRSLPEEDRKNKQTAFENFISIARIIDALGIPYTVDFSEEPDLEYYTGIQFQILSSPGKKSKKDVLVSGGRYDDFISEMWDLSERIPTVGFALYARNIIRLKEIRDKIGEAGNRLQKISIGIRTITEKNVETGRILCGKLSALGFDAMIMFETLSSGEYENYGLVIEVDHDQYPDGYQVLFSQKIGKPLLKNLFGETHVG